MGRSSDPNGGARIVMPGVRVYLVVALCATSSLALFESSPEVEELLDLGNGVNALQRSKLWAAPVSEKKANGEQVLSSKLAENKAQHKEQCAKADLARARSDAKAKAREINNKNSILKESAEKADANELAEKKSLDKATKTQEKKRKKRRRRSNNGRQRSRRN